MSFFFFFACTHPAEKKDENETKNTTDYLSELNEQLKGNPNNSDLFHKRAIYYLQQGNYDSAHADINQAININEDKATYYLTLSDIYFSTNKTRDSKSALEKAIAVDPTNTEALLKLAELYFFVKKYQESFDYINKALKIDQHISKAYFMKGMIYKEMKDTAKAISSMATAVEQNQEYYDAYLQLGLLYASQKNKLAIEFYNNALRIKPNSEEVLYVKGKLYQDLEEWDNATATYTQLLQYSPNNKFAHYNMGVIHGAEKKDYELAIKNFDNAIKSDPDYFQAYYGKGTCYELLGDRQKAKENYTKALEINPDYTPAAKSLEK